MGHYDREMRDPYTPPEARPSLYSLRERKLIEAFAVAMHALTSGSWEAAGYETQEAFRLAASNAVETLNREGLDLLGLLPKDARGEMPW